MMTREWMLERFYARDTASNGRFITGVLTTGIYCLPSCGARKPLPENVRFFDSETEARSAGLRPCRRCRPDNFYQQYDPDLHLLQTLAADLRRDPAAFADAAALTPASGIGTTKLNALFRRHFHLTPAAFLARERVDAASRVLAGGATVSAAAYAAGFESLSAFHLNFRRLTGLTPGEYRGLGELASFTVALPAGYRADVVLGYQGRDPASVVERVRGGELAKALHLGGAPAILRIRFERDTATCSVDAKEPPGAERMREAHAAAVRMLNLAGDPSTFERQMDRQPAYARLVAPRRGMRIPLTATPWECLVWTVVGQQVNLPFAYALRTAVAELAGAPVGGGLYAHPTPAAVAALDYADLTRRRFSGRKAEYLIDMARMVVGGELDVDAGRQMATEVERRLLQVRGLGPWSVNYLLMRGCGFADCVPVGDAGLTAALQRFHHLDHRPTPAETRDLMEPFAPFRSLGTVHLWSSLGDPQ